MSDLRNLRNDDFRRLLATPSSSGTSRSRGSGAKETPHGFTHKQSAASGAKKPYHKHPHKASKEQEDDIFDESQSRLNEIMRNYRDRASERRKGAVPEDDALLRAKMTAAYRAVPGTFAAAASQADRRRAEIQESKFLGGDIEHTHLVKGLDYSLLNKVRREIEDGEERDELERVYEEEQVLAKPIAEAPVPSSNKMVRNLNRLLTTKQRQPQGNDMPARNEMFARGRMAYIVELGEEVEGADDVPATLMRSVHECPDPMADAVNADAVLISKLTQVLGYLRSDAKRRKHPDEGRAHTSTASFSSPSKSGLISAKEPQPTTAGSGVKIFDDVDSEYAPSSRISKSSRKESTKRQEVGGQSASGRSYFDDCRRTGERRNEREKDDRRRERSQERNHRTETSDSHSDRKKATESREHVPSVSAEVKVGGMEAALMEEDSKLAGKKRRLEEEEDAYAELYPMGAGMVFAGGDSDDEGEDFSKMDMGNKKGPVKRWDFETQGEFEKYQGAREAVPKAAFQYGMKTNEGRKTRKSAAAEKAAEERKLDREMERINKVWDDRKKSAPDSTASKEVVMADTVMLQSAVITAAAAACGLGKFEKGGKPLPPPPSSVKPRNESLGSTLPTYRNRPSTHGTASSGLSGISFANTRSMFEKLKDSKELRTGLSNIAKNPMVQKAAVAVAKDERVQSAAISAIRNSSVQTAAINATLSSNQSGVVQQPLSIREKNIASLAKQFESKPIMGIGVPPPVGHRSMQTKHDNASSGTGSIYPSLSAMDPFDYPPQIPSTNSTNSAAKTESSIQKFAWENSASAKSPEPLTNEPHAIVKYPYRAAGPDELSCTTDDTVLLNREVDGQWIYATNVRTGEAGIVPLSFLHVKVPLAPTSTMATTPTSPYHYDATSPAGQNKYVASDYSAYASALNGAQSSTTPIRFSRGSSMSDFGLGLGQSLKVHDMPTAKALFDFDTGVDGDLVFRCGTLIAITGKVNDEWLRGEVDGVQGIFPTNYVQLDAPHDLTSLPSVLSSAKESNRTTVTAAYDFQSDVEGDLRFSAGDVIEVVKGPTEPNGGWIVGRLHGVTGLVPLTYVNHNFLS